MRLLYVVTARLMVRRDQYTWQRLRLGYRFYKVALVGHRQRHLALLFLLISGL